MRPMPPRKRTTTDHDFAPAPYAAPPQPVVQPEETFTFKAKHFYAVLVVLAFGIGVLVGYFAWGRAPATPTYVAVPVTQQAAPPVPAITPTAEHVKYNIPTEGFPAVGPADAPITIVEFSDYQCPYCTQWHDNTEQPLMAAYPGKIRLVYRNYPLSFHQNAMMGAEAALCAGDQNAYWKYHDKLFSENSLMNSSAGTVVTADQYVKFATDIGLDGSAFQTCLTTEKYKKAVQDDVSFADSLPTENGEAAVGGTPTFFINGQRVVGAYPLSFFQQIIDADLAGKPGG
jgi:protein-disulfide isomerase